MLVSGSLCTAVEQLHGQLRWELGAGDPPALLRKPRPKVEQLWVVGEPHPPATAVTFRAEDNPLLFDFDDDGRIEFCAFHWQQRLVVHDALSGKVKGEFKLPATPTTRASAAADVDGDGRPELLYGAGNTVRSCS